MRHAVRVKKARAPCLQEKESDMSLSPTRLTFLPRHLLFNESNIQSLHLWGRKSNLLLDDRPQQPFLAEHLPGLGERGDFSAKMPPLLNAGYDASGHATGNWKVS